jgi:cytochrome c oxidase subunit II
MHRTKSRFLAGKDAALTLLIQRQVFGSLTVIKDSVAAAGTALLLGAAAMSHQQDPAAASAPFDSHATGVAARTLAQGRPSDNANGVAAGTLAQGKASESEPRTIDIVAKRFGFEPARIEVKAGERVRLVLKSADGVHGVEIKKFRVNKKIPRGGEPVTIEFTATTAGQFPILCSEYCGEGHEEMKGILVVIAN